MRRSTVLSLPLQQRFPCFNVSFVSENMIGLPLRYSWFVYHPSSDMATGHGHAEPHPEHPVHLHPDMNTTTEKEPEPEPVSEEHLVSMLSNGWSMSPTLRHLSLS